MGRSTAFIGLAVAACLACTDTVGPDDDFELPPPDPSLDPARLTVGEVIASPCGPNTHLSGDHRRAVVDFYFPGGGGELRHPSLRELDLVRRRGGTLIHAFAVPIVRARIALSEVPAVVDRFRWAYATRDVPDLTRYDVPLTVGFRDQGEDEIELFRTLGGRVEHVYSFSALHGVLPDRSIDELHRLADVEYIEIASIACLAGSEEGPPATAAPTPPGSGS